MKPGSRSRKVTFAALGLLALLAAPWTFRRAEFWYYSNAARHYLRHAQPDWAIERLEAALAAAPDHAETHYWLGVAHRRCGHLDDCRPHFDQAVRLGWSRRQVARQLRLLAFQGGDRGAEAELKEELKGGMDDDVAEETCEALVLGYFSEYRIADAEICLNHWLRWRPDAVQARLFQADIPALTGDSTAQVDQYREVLKREPEHYKAHLFLAQASLLRHEVETSLEHFRWCLAHLPGDSHARLGIAACLHQLGRLDEARTMLGKIDSPSLADDQRAKLMNELGQLALEQRDFPTAAKFLADSVRLFPADARAQYSLGMVLSRMDKKDEAQRHLELSRRIEEVTSRLHDLESDLASDPSNAELRCEAGELLTQLGRPKAAAAMMLAALRFDPAHAKAHAALVEYYEAIGRRDLADKHRALLAAFQEGIEAGAVGGHESGDAPALSSSS